MRALMPTTMIASSLLLSLPALAASQGPVRPDSLAKLSPADHVGRIGLATKRTSKLGGGDALLLGVVAVGAMVALWVAVGDDDEEPASP